MAPVTNPRIILVFLLVSTLAVLDGCSMGQERSSLRHSDATTSTSTDHWTEDHTLLVKNGKFTDAAILTGLHDSSNWDSHDLEYRITGQQPQSQKDLPKSENKDALSEASLNTHLNRVGSDYVQKTTLDGKWHARLGWSLMVSGNHKAAAAAYREALRQNDTLVDAYLGLGILLKRQGNVKTAVEAFRKALTINPQYAAALVHLGYAYADGQNSPKNIQKAKRLFYRASKQGDPFAMIALIDLKTRR